MARQWLVFACLVTQAFGVVRVHANSVVGPHSTNHVQLSAFGDIADLPNLADCLAGPGALPAPSGMLTAQQCLDLFDFNNDNDVDLDDSAVWLQVVQACTPEFQDCATGDCLNELACVGNGNCSDSACACDDGWIGGRCSISCDGGDGMEACLLTGSICGGHGFCPCDNPVNDLFGQSVQCCRCQCFDVYAGWPYVGSSCECGGSGAHFGDVPDSSVEFQPSYAINPISLACSVGPHDITWTGAYGRSFEIWFRLATYNQTLLTKYGCPQATTTACSPSSKSANWVISVGNAIGSDNGRTIRFGSGTNWVSSQPVDHVPNQWHHVAVVVQDQPGMNNTEVYIYIDGELDTSNTEWQTVSRPNCGPIIIGRFDDPITPSTNLVGDIAEVRMWDHARTSVQIVDNMHNKITDPIELSKLLLYVKFDEQNTNPQTAPVDSSDWNLPGVLIGDVEYEILSPVFDPNDPSTQTCQQPTP